MRNIWLLFILISFANGREPTKTIEIKALVAMVSRGDTYVCQQIHRGKPMEKFYTVRVHNVSCYNILSEVSRVYMEDQIFGKEITITVRFQHKDTLIGDIEYRDPESRKETSAAQTLIRKGWSSYLRESPDKGLEILEEMAEDQRVGVWKILDPEKIKVIQDSIRIRQERMLDTLQKEFEKIYAPVDSTLIL